MVNGVDRYARVRIERRTVGSKTGMYQKALSKCLRRMRAWKGQFDIKNKKNWNSWYLIGWLLKKEQKSKAKERGINRNDWIMTNLFISFRRGIFFFGPRASCWLIGKPIFAIWWLRMCRFSSILAIWNSVNADFMWGNKFFSREPTTETNRHVFLHLYKTCKEFLLLDSHSVRLSSNFLSSCSPVLDEDTLDYQGKKDMRLPAFALPDGPGFGNGKWEIQLQPISHSSFCSRRSYLSFCLGYQAFLWCRTSSLFCCFHQFRV